MSVLVFFRWEPRRVSHTCTRTDDGLVVVDVWHSEKDFQRMMEDPEFRRNV